MILKPRLVILSDMYGNIYSDWVKNYIQLLNPYFEVQYYDCRQLGEVDLSLTDSTDLHQSFLNGGIEAAVNNLIQLEKEEVTLLGFSIGGTIAWKSVLGGLKARQLFAVSSTRLRHETQKPEMPVLLSYGENDIHKPNSDWFNIMNIQPQIIENAGHGFYQSWAEKGIKWILNKVNG